MMRRHSLLILFSVKQKHDSINNTNEKINREEALRKAVYLLSKSSLPNTKSQFFKRNQFIINSSNVC